MNSSYTWLLPVLIVCCCTLFAEESRAWRNDKGKTLEGILVIQDNTHAKIRSDKSGKIYNVKIESLSSSDQRYLADLALTADAPADAPADVVEASETDAGALAKLLALGLAAIIAIFLGIIIVSILIQAVFLHMATRLLSFDGSFFTAIGGTIMVVLMQCVGQVLTFMVLSSDITVTAIIGLVVPALFGGFGVKIAYGEPLGKCILAYIITFVLYIIAAVMLFLLAAVVIGISLT